MKNNDIISKITFFKVEDDTQTFKLANKLLNGDILCLDFNSCPVNQAERVLDFLAGVNYATDGYVSTLSKNIYLFAIKEDYKDPDLKKFISDYSK